MLDKIIKRTLTQRNPHGNKGTFGHLLIVAGSDEMPGCLHLIARSALASGVGYIEISYRTNIPQHLISAAPECIYQNRRNLRNTDFLKRYSTILFGNGMTALDKEDAKDFDFIMKNYEGRLVIDGTGFLYLMNYYEHNDEKTVRPEIIILPHIKEFAAMMAIDVSNSDPVTYRDKVETYLIDHPRSTVMLKSYKTLIKTTKNEYLLNVGNSGLAKAGSGDALAGFVAGLLAYCPAFNIDICYAAAMIFGAAADRAIKRESSASISASKVIDQLPHLLKKYIN